MFSSNENSNNNNNFRSPQSRATYFHTSSQSAERDKQSVERADKKFSDTQQNNTSKNNNHNNPFADENFKEKYFENIKEDPLAILERNFGKEFEITKSRNKKITTTRTSNNGENNNKIILNNCFCVFKLTV